MFIDLIEKTGLSKDQASVYSTLLEGGHMTARKIAQRTNLKRGLAYKVIDQLIELGLVEKNEKLSKIALFFPAHPHKLKEIIKRKETEIATANETLNGVMGKMISNYNLVSGKPNVQFFEGIQGIEQVVFDAIESGAREILEYLDDEAVLNTLPDLNKSHVQARKNAGIKKRILAVDTPKTRERVQGFDPSVTEVRFIKTPAFATVMQIYENKVSYITLHPERVIGVIIEGKEIFDMHKTLFEEQWKNATKIA